MGGDQEVKLLQNFHSRRASGVSRYGGAALVVAVSFLMLFSWFEFNQSVQKKLERADAHLWNKEFDEALKLYKQVLSKEPKNFKAQAHQALAYAWNGEYDTALSLFDRLLLSYPKDAELLLNRANTFKWKGDFKAAEAAFSQAFKIQPTYVPIIEGLAEAFNRTGKYEQAIEMVNAGLKLSPNNARLWVTRAWAWRWLDQYEQALGDLRQVFKTELNNPAALELQLFIIKYQTQAAMREADQLLWRDDIRGAIIQYDKILAEDPDNFVVLSRKALGQSRSGEYERALALFDQLLLNHPEDIELRLNRANTLRWKGDLAGAEAAYSETLERSPGNVEVTKSFSEVLNLQGKHREAIEVCESGLLRDPDNIPLLMSQAWAWRWLKEFDKSYEVLSKILENDPQNTAALDLKRQVSRLSPEVLIEEADQKLWNREMLASIQQYNEIIAMDPGNFKARSHQALAYAWNRQFDEALVLFDKLLLTYPEDAELLLNRANTLKWKGDFKEAETAFSEALKIHANHLPMIEGLAETLNRTGKHEQSITVADTGLKLDPQNANLWMSRAWASCWLGNYDSATEDLKRAIEIQPDHPAAAELQSQLEKLKLEKNLSEADALLWSENFIEAIQKYDEVLTMEPENFTAESHRALAYARNRQYDQAITLYEKLLLAKPDDPELLLNYANTLKWKGDRPKAREIYGRALALDPRNLNLLQEIGEILNLEGKNQEAVEIYSRGLEIDAQKTTFLIGRAWARRWLKEYEKAGEDLEKILELDPSNASAHELQAQLFIAEADENLWDGNLAKSIELYDAILAQDPENFQAKLHKALAYSWSGQHEDATHLYNELLKKDPENPEVLLNLAKVQSWRGRLLRAEKTYRRALQKDPLNAGLLHGLSDTLSWQGKNREAIRIENQALKLDPENPEFLSGRAWNWYWLGLYGKANRDLRQALSIKKDFGPALSLQDRLRKKLGGYLRNDFSYFRDSNNLKRYFEQVQTGWVFPTGTDLSFFYRLRIFQNTGMQRIRSHGSGVAVKQTINSALEVNSQVFYDEYRNTSVSPWTMNHWLTWTPTDFLRLDTGYERNTFDTVESLRREIIRDIYKVGLEVKPVYFITLRGNYSYEALSDKNRRSIFYSQVEWKIWNKPHVWLDYHNYYFKYSEQFSHGYFNPQSFLNQGAGLRMEMPVDSKEKFVLRFYGGLNPEMENPGDSKMAGVLQGGADVNLSQYYRIKFDYSYLSSRLSQSDSYEFHEFKTSLESQF